MPDKYSEINCAKLKELLIKRYQDNNVEIDDNRNKTIDNDVDVISYIYRLRGNNPASNLKHYCPRNSFNIKKSNKLTVTHQN